MGRKCSAVLLRLVPERRSVAIVSALEMYCTSHVLSVHSIVIIISYLRMVDGICLDASAVEGAIFSVVPLTVALFLG